MSDERSPGPLQFTDLLYGALNNFGTKVTSMFGSGSKRRGTSKSFLHTALRSTYKKSSLTGVTEFYGVIINMRVSDFMTYRRKDTLFAEIGSDDPRPKSVFIYKVYIPELECRPFPLDPFDPVIFTYPDVYSLPRIDGNSGFSYGQIVRVSYSNSATLTDPMIVGTEGDMFLGFEGLDEQILEELWKLNPTAILGIPDYDGPIPQAEKLVNAIETDPGWMNVTLEVPGGRGNLTSGGDLSSPLADAAVAFFGALSVELPQIEFTISGGNDRFHHGIKCREGTDQRSDGREGTCYTSSHTHGAAIDFTIDPPTVAHQRAVEQVLRGFAAGSPNFRYLNEYQQTGKRSGNATGDHFHVSWGGNYTSHGDTWANCPSGNPTKGDRTEILAEVEANTLVSRTI